MNTQSGDNEVNQTDVVESIPSAPNDQIGKTSSTIPIDTPMLAQKYIAYFFSTGLVGSLFLGLETVILGNSAFVVTFLVYIWLTAFISVALLLITRTFWLKPIHFHPKVTDLTVVMHARMSIVLEVLIISSFMVTSIILGHTPELWLYAPIEWSYMFFLLRYAWRYGCIAVSCFLVCPICYAFWGYHPIQLIVISLRSTLKYIKMMLMREFLLMN